jgi:hypothetical protein
MTFPLLELLKPGSLVEVRTRCRLLHECGKDLGEGLQFISHLPFSQTADLMRRVDATSVNCALKGALMRRWPFALTSATASRALQ